MYARIIVYMYVCVCTHTRTYVCMHHCMPASYLGVAISLLLPDWLPEVTVSTVRDQEPIIVLSVRVEDNTEDDLHRRELKFRVSSGDYRWGDQKPPGSCRILVVVYPTGRLGRPEGGGRNPKRSLFPHCRVAFHVANDCFTADSHVSKANK